MREEGHKYTSFWKTLRIVYREEGRRGLYRGLATQLVRQIPNTAIMMSTYELTYYVLTKYNVDGVAPSSLFSAGEKKNSAGSEASAASPACDNGDAIRVKTSHSQ